MKAKTHQLILSSWVVVSLISIGVFFLARQHVVANRTRAMKIRRENRKN